jgi:hypothetical protein
MAAFTAASSSHLPSSATEGSSLIVPLGSMCRATLNSGCRTVGIKITRTLASVPEYKGDYATIYTTNPKVCAQLQLPPVNDNDPYRKLAMIVNEFGPWWISAHRDLFNSIVIECLSV